MLKESSSLSPYSLIFRPRITGGRDCIVSDRAPALAVSGRAPGFSEGTSDVSVSAGFGESALGGESFADAGCDGTASDPAASRDAADSAACAAASDACEPFEDGRAPAAGCV